jgi:hypothetical protein
MASTAGTPGSRAAHFFQQLETLAVEHLRAPFEHRGEQLALAAEVIGDQRHVHTGSLGDIAQRHAVEAALREQLLGGIEDALFAGAAHRGLFLHLTALQKLTGRRQCPGESPSVATPAAPLTPPQRSLNIISTDVE